MLVEQQVSIPIECDGMQFDEGFRADIIVAGKVILELKSVEQLSKVHHKQLFTYLKLFDKRLGILLNFGANLMKEGIKRIAEGLAEFSTDSDTLGDAYEYLIGQFAAGSGKKAGEFYTPQHMPNWSKLSRQSRRQRKKHNEFLTELAFPRCRRPKLNCLDTRMCQGSACIFAGELVWFGQSRSQQAV